MADCIIQTPCGAVRGAEEHGVRLFRGIPYAVTERFERPVPITSWEGEFDATAGEIDCWQYSSFRDDASGEGAFFSKEFRSGMEFRYAESPMTLNIVAPSDAEKAPVLIFIHGGGHETGTVGEMPYGDCSVYAREGIVFASVGYRLNVFSLYENLNLGLHDMIEAVRWLYRNVAAFGGDPERMTLIGQSAGAMSITDLLYCDKLRGLVRGAVLMSGGGAVPKLAGPWPKEKVADYWAKIRERAGAASEEDFKKLPPREIWEAWFAECREHYDFHLVQPGIDGEIIRDEPGKLLREGKCLDIPLIFGVTSQDFLAPILYYMARQWGRTNARLRRAPVYGYFFDRTPPGNSYKAFHSVDLWYVFGNMERCWRPFEETDYALHRQMVSYVANFVKTGDPNGEGLPRWPILTGRQKGLRKLDGVTDGLAYPGECWKKTIYSFTKDKGPL